MWITTSTSKAYILMSTGAVVLSTTDIAEGTHLYFTEARATANFTANIAETSITSLKDGSHVLLDTDTFTIDGGKA